MSAIVPKFGGARPKTYRCVQQVTGAQLVESRTSAATKASGAGVGIGPAAAGSTTFLGVALDDAIPAGSGFDQGTTAYGASFVDTSVYPSDVAVIDEGTVPGVLYVGAATPGQRMKCAAAGGVTPWVSGTDSPQLIVGWCDEPQGVAAGARGDFKIKAN